MEISGAFPVLNQDYLDTFFSFDEPTSQQSVNPDIHQQVPIPAGAQGRIEQRPSFSMPQGQPNGAGSQEPIGWSTVGQPSPFTDMSQPSFTLDMSQQSFGPSGYELSTGFSTPQYPANVGVPPRPIYQPMGQPPPGPTTTQGPNNQYMSYQPTNNTGMSQAYITPTYSHPPPLEPASMNYHQQPLLLGGAPMASSQPGYGPYGWSGQPTTGPPLLGNPLLGEDPMVSASSPAVNPLLGEALMVSGPSGPNPGAAHSGQAYSITQMPPAAAAISNQGLRQQRPSAGTPVRPTTYVPRTLKELKMRGYAPTDNVAANNIYHEKLYGKLVKKENAKKRRLNKLHK